MKLAIAVVVAIGMFGLGLGGAYALGLQAISNSQHQWCSTLILLTQRPVPRPTDPQANPSRENAYVFYSNLVTLRQRFGC